MKPLRERRYQIGKQPCAEFEPVDGERFCMYCELHEAECGNCGGMHHEDGECWGIPKWRIVI